MTDGNSTLARTSIGDQFRADGYYSPIRAMSEGDALRYRARLEESEKVRGRQLSRAENSMPHFLFDWAAEIVRLPAILDEATVNQERMPVLLTRPEQSDTGMRGLAQEAMAMAREYPSEQMHIVQTAHEKDQLVQQAL